MATRKKRLPTDRPRGRAEVSAAVIKAAGKLFANKPYGDVTMRDIADAAAVNLGLLHRHFGGKQRIIRAVMDQYAAHYRDVVLASKSAPRGIVVLFADPTQARFLRTLAHLVLSELDVRKFISDEGAISALLRHQTRHFPGGADQAEGEVRLLVAFALLTGWTLFGNFLTEAAGNRFSRAEIEQAVHDLAISYTARPRTPRRS